MFAVWLDIYHNINHLLRLGIIAVIELIAFAPAPASLTVFGRGPRPTKALCESNQFYSIMVYAQLHSLRYANIGPPNGERLICRVFYTVCAEGFLAVDAGTTMAAWVVAAFVAGPGKLVWHA